MKDILLIAAVCAAAALFLGVCYRFERIRSVAMQALAMRLRFRYLGEGVPRSLTLRGTEVANASRIWNVIDRDPPGFRIIAFDFRMGTGKRSWTSTAIAVEQRDDAFTRER